MTTHIPVAGSTPSAFGTSPFAGGGSSDQTSEAIEVLPSSTLRCEVCCSENTSTLNLSNMVRLVALPLLSVFLASAASAQTGCELAEWMNGLPPNAELTPERSVILRDTQVMLGSTARTAKLPPGFTMTRFAEVSGARGIALSPDGVIFVTGYGGGGRVYAFPDHDNDGVADSAIVVRNGPGAMHGIAFVNGALYVSTTSQVLKLVSTDNDREAEEAVVIASLDPGGNHASRTLEYDAKRNKLYVSVGSTCNICTEEEPERASILEMNPDGTERRIYASGLRNAVGMDIDPRTGALWANSNEADNVFGSGHPLTNENPKEPISIICDGGHYGWPYGYGYKMRYPFGEPIDTSFFETAKGPVGQMLAHSAPLGMHFIQGKSFPSKYHRAQINTLHGSWNRQPPAPPRVMAFWSSPDGRNAVLEDFVTGFQAEAAPYTRWGRPVSAAEGTDGALYVTDDYGHAVYRIAYTGEAGRSIKITSQLEGTTQPGGLYLPIEWTATGVDTFVILSRLSPLDNFDTVYTTKYSSFVWIVPDISAPQAAIRVESTNGLTFAETGYFAIEPFGSGVSPSAFRDQALIVKPNPARDHIELGLKDGKQIDKVELLDLRGAVVIQLTGHRSQFSVANIAQGSYIVRVSSGNEIYTSQVVISR
jgi:glucose/arabinose dehydrogenase